jgi:hypothetical protein
MQEFICPLCSKELKNLNFYLIHMNTHKNKEQYPNGFDCFICQKHFPAVRGFKRHITEEHNTKENKILAYQLLTGDFSKHVCVNCGKDAILDNHYEYKDWCEECRDIVCKKNHKSAMEKVDYTKVDFISRNEKSIKTWIKNTGYDHPSRNPKTQIKTKNTKIKTYGEDYANVILAKSHNTYEQKTGYKNPFNNPNVQDKALKTRTDNLPNGFSMFTKAFNTLEEKTGYRYPQQNQKSRQETINTCLRKFNATNPQKNEIIHKKTVETFKTNQENGLHKNPFEDEVFKNTVLNKMYETKKKNNSFHISKLEKILYQKLLVLYPLIEFQKRDYPNFPFNVDYYIPNYDLLIEYQGTWTHGKEQFDENNDSHIQKLSLWKEKAKYSKYYENAIQTWTIRDVNKRNIADKLGIKYLRLYTYNIDMCIKQIQDYIRDNCDNTN